MLKRFESLEEFLTVCETEGWEDDRADHFARSPEWYGNQSYRQALTYSRVGDDSLVPQAQAMLDALDTDIDLRGYRWTASTAGAYACVPDHLAGSATPMRARQKMMRELSPVNLYVSTTISAAITPEQIATRGAAILALVMRLEAVRPVTLHVLAELHGRDEGHTTLVIPVPSRPIALSVACHLLTSASFPRHLTYTYGCKKNRFNGRWSRQYKGFTESRYPTHPASPYALWLRELIGMDEDDLYIKPAHVQQDVVSNPVRWLNETLANFRDGR